MEREFAKMLLKQIATYGMMIFSIGSVLMVYYKRMTLSAYKKNKLKMRTRILEMMRDMQGAYYLERRA